MREGDGDRIIIWDARFTMVNCGRGGEWCAQGGREKKAELLKAK